MATSQETMDFLLDQLAGAGAFSSRRMFGEFCLYLAGKPVGLVCDDQLYVKPTEPGRALMGRVEEGFPFPGARAHLRVTADRWEEREWLAQLLLATAAVLPEPRPKKPRARKGAGKTVR